MAGRVKNELILVWGLLSASTIASWYIGQLDEVGFHLNAWVTVGVLVIASIKAQLVIQYFMEVRFAPRWLKLFMVSWSVVLVVTLLIFYWIRV